MYIVFNFVFPDPVWKEVVYLTRKLPVDISFPYVK